MKKTATTAWFPMSTYPYRIGVYEVKISEHSIALYSKWDGRRWNTIDSSVDWAAKMTSASRTCYEVGCKWRGLAANPGSKK